MFTDYFELPDGRIFYKVYGSSDESNKKINPQQRTLIYSGPQSQDSNVLFLR
jgi:hypothetical protein